MIDFFRNKGFIRLLWGSMALYLLNICVDIPDAESSLIPEDLSINDQESMIEIILEEILGFEDAIPEHDDPDSDEPETQKKNGSFKIEPFPIQKAYESQSNCLMNQEIKFPDIDQLLIEGYGKLLTPPPQA